MARISEDIRFYLPSDPYYFKVDNLPLQDLLKNDKRLQTQIDALQQADVGVTVNRAGILELKPFIDNAIPGTISVRPGNFIGRVQRSSNASGVPGSTLDSVYNGTEEIGEPPTVPVEGFADWKYNTGNPPDRDQNPAYSVGRTAVFNFPGGTISIDGFSNGDFQSVTTETMTFAPAGRIDLVGITTVNGAQDDPFIPGNADDLNVAIGNGQARLAVVKGAGLIGTNEDREIGVVANGRYHTIGAPQDEINLVAKAPDGTLTEDPKVGTYPLPDDVVNVCFSRNDIREAMEGGALIDWAQRNRNASFFLPIAYVFVNDTYTVNNPIPENWLYDIRPLFRTAELTLSERQSLAASVNPSVANPVVTASYQETRFTEEVNRTAGVVNIQAQIDDLKSQLETAFSNINGSRIVTTEAITVTSNLSTSYVSYFPASEFGIPDTATHVILWGKIQGDIDNSTPEIMVQGSQGDYILAAARGQGEAGRDDTDTGMTILALNNPGESTSNFRAKRTTSQGNETGTLQIRGYIEPIANSFTFTTPQES